MTFYQTSSTIQRGISNKSIEVFAANRGVFEIGIQSDFGIQLNETANLKEKIFPPMKKTFLIFHDFDELKNVKSVVKNKSVMSDNRDVFMANFMTRNMKNINTLQTLTGIIGTDRSKWIKYEPSKSNERNYVELFMSSMDSMGSDIIERL